jgi:hypothetical protein
VVGGAAWSLLLQPAKPDRASSAAVNTNVFIMALIPRFWAVAPFESREGFEKMTQIKVPKASPVEHGSQPTTTVRNQRGIFDEPKP